MRTGKYDVIVGINLLREGLDIPEVSLVTILDADKEGFLRSDRSLIQTIGRAARNENGRVIMYADKVTKSMQFAIDETYRRRTMQIEYNEKHGITPKTIKKEVRDVIKATAVAEGEESYESGGKRPSEMTKKEREETIDHLETEMKQAARDLDFEKAAELRDVLLELKAEG